MTETVAAPAAPASPYKGLTHYTEDDAAFFFGREAEIEIIVANLMAFRLTLLYGESGVGKSSVLRAGVMRRLREESAHNLAERGEPEFLAVAFSDWHDDPVADLGRAIHAAAEDLYGDRLDADPAGGRLDETIAAWAKRIDGDLILVLDQFEEYFLYHPAEDGPGTFAAELARALNRGDLRVSFLIGIREDALAKLDAFKGRIPHLFDNYLRIEHLSPKAARAAIEKPIASYNGLLPDGAEQVTIEPELVEAVLGQVRAGQLTLGQVGKGTVDSAAGGPPGGDEQIETPFLQLVMTRLWTEEIAAGSHALRLSTLERLGGAERIVCTHLDHAMERLPLERQEVAAEVFHHLVTPSGMKIAHALSDLAEYADRSEHDLLPVLEELSGPDVRILRPVAPPPGEPGGLRYEIFHDVLAPAILDWRARWVQAESERELAASLENQEHERELAQAQAAREYRRARTFRALAAVAIVVAAIAVVLGVWAFGQKDLAQRQRSTARSEELVARSTTELAIDPRVSLAQAVAAMDEKPTTEAEGALRAALARAPRVMLRGHNNWVNTARFSPDGRYVVTASDDKTARIWDATSGRQVKVLRGHTDFVDAANWSPDGSYVVTGGDKTARIWAWRARARPMVIHVVRQPGARIVVATVSSGGPHGEYIATASYDDVARIYDARTGELLWHRVVPDLMSARLDPSGTRVVTASRAPDLKARVFSWRRPRSAPVILNRNHKQNDSLNAAVLSPDGTKVVTGSDDNSLAVWDARTGKNVSYATVAKAPIRAVAMNPDGRLVAEASDDGLVYLFDWRAENLIATIPGHGGVVSDVSFSPDGRTLVSASGDRTARLWPVPPLVTLPHRGAGVEWASWSPDGRRVATASQCQTIGSSPELVCYGKIWDAATGRIVHHLKGHTSWVSGAAFSPNGRYVVTSGLDHTARIWSVRTGGQVAVLKRHTDWVMSASYDPTGRFVATSSSDGTARIWNWRTRSVTAVMHEPRKEALDSATFSHDGRYLLTTTGSPHDRTARIWDWRRSGSKAFRVLKGHAGAVNNASWSRSGRYVVTASSDHTARVWDWRAGRTLAVLSGQAGALEDAAFSPNGRLVVTTSADGSTRIWDWRAGKPLSEVKWQQGFVHSAAFSPDGTRVLTASDDWSAMIFRCETCGPLDQLLRTARARVARTVTPGELDALLPNKEAR